MRGLRVAVVMGLVAASFAAVAGPASADPPANEYLVSAGGNHDWIPATGAAPGSPSAAPVTITGTMADTLGQAPYVAQSGPGIVRARQAGNFRNLRNFTYRFDPILTATSTNRLTVAGPGSTVAASLNVHVDGQFTSSCGSMTICEVKLDVQTRLGSQVLSTVVSKEQGVLANQLGLTIDAIPGGVHVHGDVQTPPVTVSLAEPVDAALSIDVRAAHLGDGSDSSSTWDARFDAASFAPTGPVLGVPAGYTVSGVNVVDNAWTDPFTAPGAISGAVVYDVDGDGAHDASDVALTGIDVFVDADDDGTLDAGEPSYTTDASGRYVFLGLDPGTYTIDYEVSDLPVDFSNTGTKPRSVIVAAGDDLTSQDFFAEHPLPALGADYRFADTRASSVGTPPDLADIGPGTNTFTDADVDGTDQRVLTFPDGNGLALAPTAGVIPNDRYTIVMQAKFEPFDVQAKLVVFDQGVDVSGGFVVESFERLYFSGAGSCPGGYPTPVVAGEWYEFALTRDSTGALRGYVDGIEQFACNNPSGQAVVAPTGLQFFLGYPDVFHAAGSVARIRLFDNAMTATEIAALDQPAPPDDDVVITDCDDPALASITTIAGDLIADNVPGCDAIDLPNLTSVGGDMTVTTEAVSGNLDFGSLDSVGGDMTVTAEAVSGNLDFGSLDSVGGDMTVTTEAVSGNLDFGSLGSVGGDMTVTAEAVSGNLDFGSLTSVTGDLTLDLDGYDEVDGTTADGSTTVANATAEAVMRVVLPDGTYETAVPFTITHLDPATLDPEAGTDADGNPATIDGIAAYEFGFDVPTLGVDATLTFDVLVDGLDATTRATLLAALDAGTATLATRGDGPTDTPQAFALCTGVEVPTADGCVLVERLDANGQPTTGVPAIVRFTGVTGHFSDWAVAIVESDGDTTPPVIDAHADVIAEATSASGANVVYTVPGATDDVDGPVTVSCLPGSGSAFPFGTTTVNCSAHDAAGNPATSSFGVLVRDTTAPVITVPADITRDATGPAGATVNFVATAADAVDGITPAGCTPASGSTFPIGATSVACTKTDTHGNPAAVAGFTVTVLAGATPPGAPAVSAIAGWGAATVNWTKPGDGGAAISGYVVQARVGATIVGTASLGPNARTHTFGGLANGVAHTFSVVAANAKGPGPAGTASATPFVPRRYRLLDAGVACPSFTARNPNDFPVSVGWLTSRGRVGLGVVPASSTISLTTAPRQTLLFLFAGFLQLQDSALSNC